LEFGFKEFHAVGPATKIGFYQWKFVAYPRTARFVVALKRFITSDKEDM